MKTKLYSVTSLIAPFIDEIKETKAEKDKGICAFCANLKSGYNAIGVMRDLKLFTRYGDMELYGGTICFDCFKVFRNQKVRYRHWLATLSKWQFLKREEILSVLLNPPAEPWAIYITESHKKHGWIRGMYAINYSNNSNIRIIHEEFILETTINEISKISKIVQQLLDEGFSKKQIKGEWTPTSLNKLMGSHLYTVYLELNDYKDTNILYIIVYLSTKIKTKELENG